MNIKLSEHFSYRKLIRFSLPTIAMMIFTSLYGVVDGLFVSNYAGKTPFAAVNLIMPVLIILGTVGFMFGSGGTALVAVTYGTGDKERANGYFSLFVYTALKIGIFLAIVGFAFIRPIAVALKAEGELLENCVLYARIILLALPFYVLQVMFQSFFVVAEKPQLGLIITVLSGGTNMVLDALLVILLPQEYKLAGAAIATAISQVVGGIIPLFYFMRENSSFLRLGKSVRDKSAIIKACINGSSEFMSNVSMSIVGMLYNSQLMKLEGENGISAYGVMMYVSMIFAAIFLGYTVGSAPVISYHYGAGNEKELKSLLRKSLRLLGIFGICMAAAAELLAAPLSSFFVGYDRELYELTVSGFRIFALSFLFMGFGIFISGFFTALNDGVTSGIVSFLRTLLFQCGTILIFPVFWGITGVWSSVAAAELMAIIVGVFFLIIKQKKYGY